MADSIPDHALLYRIVKHKHCLDEDIETLEEGVFFDHSSRHLSFRDGPEVDGRKALEIYNEHPDIREHGFNVVAVTAGEVREKGCTAEFDDTKSDPTHVDVHIPPGTNRKEMRGYWLEQAKNRGWQA